MHTMNQFFHFNNGYAGIDIGHGVGNDQLVIMNDRTARINMRIQRARPGFGLPLEGLILLENRTS